MIEKLKTLCPEPEPFVLDWDGWRKHDADYRAAHPVKFFVYKTLPRKVGRCRNHLRNFYWAIQHRFNPRHRYNIVRTGLPPGYYDKDTQLLHACFQLLVDYVERENPDNFLDIASNPMESWRAALTEMKSLYDWWTKERPAEGKRIESMDDHAAAHVAEKNLEDVEDANLIRLIEVRGFLWS